VRSRAFIVGLAGAVAVAAWIAVFAAVALAGTTPPFTQCPKVGQDPSCAILVVVNSDDTVSVLGDPAVGPFDGGELSGDLGERPH
jgi:hypothetical protein